MGTVRRSGMVHADLHVHTDLSDGTLSLSEVPAVATKAGVSVVGVTDHDRFHPGFDAPIEERDGIVLVRGIELRVETPEQRVDLLGYGVEPTEDLKAETERLQANRIERGRSIVDCLESRLGVTLDVSLEEGIGRPHIARAVTEHPATDYDRIEAVFDELIGDEESCFVPREVPNVERGLSLLRDATAFVGLAHPFRYPDPGTALELCADLDAVERYYPYDRPVGHDSTVDDGELDRVIEAHDLLATGGSDAHGRELGTAGLSEAEWERVAARLPPVS